MADDIDAWITAELELCGINCACRALTLLQQTRAALRTRLSEHATEQGRACECTMCVSDRKVLGGEM